MRPQIREASLKDIHDLVAMAREALAHIHPNLPFDPQITEQMIEEAILDDAMLVIVAEDKHGLCGLLIAKAELSWFGPGSVASDWLTYVDPRAKGWLWYRLLDAYTAWAEFLGVTVINTVNLSGKDDDRSVRAIGRLGYEKAGSMVRRIGTPFEGNA